jgi:hypothetical protein
MILFVNLRSRKCMYDNVQSIDIVQRRRYRMSTYDIVHPTYDIVRLLEGVAQRFSITQAQRLRHGHMR